MQQVTIVTLIKGIMYGLIHACVWAMTSSLSSPDLSSAQGVIALGISVPALLHARGLILKSVTPCAEERSGHARLHIAS